MGAESDKMMKGWQGQLSNSAGANNMFGGQYGAGGSYTPGTNTGSNPGGETPTVPNSPLTPMGQPGSPYGPLTPPPQGLTPIPMGQPNSPYGPLTPPPQLIQQGGGNGTQTPSGGQGGQGSPYGNLNIGAALQKLFSGGSPSKF